MIKHCSKSGSSSAAVAKTKPRFGRVRANVKWGQKTRKALPNDLDLLLGVYGTVIAIKILHNLWSTTIAYVVFEEEKGAEEALQAGLKINGVSVTVHSATEDCDKNCRKTMF
ncbi:hypothetical protein CASFOL_038954 [Castilleja foliolosa]|uniref:RRM domain-containing protein n=1 Tax=Castilleja foliolosa TaxID=1961234 RepID=A0ABD3BKB8_9LAMI